ncbi:MAG: serine hydrolase domain-containing protein [Vulcanimicrobiaceae bacterium]
MVKILMDALSSARDYARKYDLHGLLVTSNGETLIEEYAGGYDECTPHALYSGTKSFWGIAAAAAADDGLLDFDEPVADTIPPWREDSRKALVTIRQLLSLTAGVPFGGLGAGVPRFDDALAKPLAADPGTVFTYGGIPLQIFGAVFTKKLAAKNLTPLEYLRQRIFAPIGLQTGSWRVLKDGTATMPTGAFLTARDWEKFGALVCAYGAWGGQQLVSRANLEECWKPSGPNPRYGLGFWLDPLAGKGPFVAYASGSGKQALYIIPALETVVVHFSQSNSYQHERFLGRLTAA